MSENEINTSNSTESQESKGVVLLSDLWKGFQKYWWMVVISCVVVSVVMFVKSYSAFNPRYEVSATFTVNTQILSLTGEGIPSFSAVYDNATATNLEDTFPYIISSNILYEAICSDLDIMYVPVTFSAKAISSTNMFTLTATGSEPQMTYDILVSAMKNYPSVAKYLVGNVRLVVITDPILPTEPVNKFTYADALKGFLIGFAISTAWIIFYALMRKTVKTKFDVQNRLKLDVLGMVPAVSFKRYKDIKTDESILITNERIGSGFLEAIRVFRNQFTHLTKDDEKVVMVTSTAPGEGKTTIAVNLALSLSSVGKKILIIDADLRNPSVSDALKLDENLKFDVEKEDYSITKLSDLGVSYLKLTLKKHSYWKLMNIDFMTGLFNELRNEYDYIIVDTPPCGLVYDSSLIAQVCDSVIYVVLQDTVRLKKILLGIDNLNHNSDIHILGAVVNGAQSGISGYGDDYGYSNYGGYYKSYSKYGYGYGYGYDYGRGEKDKSSKSEKKN